MQFLPQVFASPFVPIEWQQRVKSGPLEDQRKHVRWIRDLNQNFVDDVLDAMPAEKKATVILQLNQCLSPGEAQQHFGGFGAVRRVGTLISYVVLDGVRAADAATLAMSPLVAAVEYDEPVFAHNDTSTRSVRARASSTFSPETFANLHADINGSGINIAVVDTGVDDAVHAGFAGKFFAGYDATTATPGNPDDDFGGVTTGADGLRDTAAAGDDVAIALLGGGVPDPNPYDYAVIAVWQGPNGVIDTVPAGDDVLTTLPSQCGPALLNYIAPGPDGICQSAAAGDDQQLIPVGKPISPGTPLGSGYEFGIHPGPNQNIDSVPTGDDLIRGIWHGTHVAGIALGLGVGPGCRPADDGSLPNNCAGMAPGASLVEVKALNIFGSGTTADIIDGLEWIWMHGNARVVNMSIGNDCDSDGTSTVSKVINSLVENGIAVVVSAGNSSENHLGTIAASELAITVAASDDRGTVDREDDQIAGFSTFGPRVDFTGVPADVLVGQLKPDITAPGVNIRSAEGNSAGGYHALSGTSMASPCVAGAAALLLDVRPELPPGSLKELLKRSAYVTPAHAALGPSFPAIDDRYEVHWGFGLLDVYQAAVDLGAGIADITFPACIGPAPGCPPGGDDRNCEIPGDNWANSTDILLATDPGRPIQGEPTTITVRVQNRTAALAENVVVTVGVKELGGGLNHFYVVDSKTIDINPLATVPVDFPWTPTANNHQCIQANIQYGFDTDFCNNQTQRNTDPVPASSVATRTFRVENPFNQTVQITLTPRFAGGNDAIQAFLLPTNFVLTPGDCPMLVQMSFVPNPSLPIGTRATWSVDVRGSTASRTNVELSGVQFNVEVVAAGLQRAYSVQRHGVEGRINLPLNLAGVPTSDPRATVNEILAVFNVPVRPVQGTLTPDQVTVLSTPTNTLPTYTVAFAEGGNVGQELRIVFSQPLADQHRYRISFEQFVDTDGERLLGDQDLEFRVLQGDANGSGAVTATDVSFVRGRINQPVAFGETSRADVNASGAITGPDISYVRSRIGHAAP